MFDFLKGRTDAGQEHYDKRLADYCLTAGITHGFPTQPTSLDVDPVLKLLAIGSRLGCIRVYGAVGVEMIGATEEEVVINRLKWLPGRGALAVVLENWTIQIFHIVPFKASKRGEMGLALKCSYQPETRAEVTSIDYYPSRKMILCGTDQGDIFNLSTDTCTTADKKLDQLLNHTSINQYLSEEYQSGGSLRAVEEIQICRDQAVIGYARGVAVLFDFIKNLPLKTFYSINNLQIEALDWFDPSQVYIGFNDGSTCLWRVDDDLSQVKYDNLYGSLCERNEKCKPIQKINKIKDLKILHGGLPRSTYGDRYSITVSAPSAQVAFDFTSKIVDYRVTVTGGDDAESLIVLCEEEIVAIDLISANWPVFRVPYLASPHSSALTGCNMSQVSKDVLEKIKGYYSSRNTGLSKQNWPINGGKNLSIRKQFDDDDRPVLLTGHEDGSVKIWDLSDNQFQFVAKVDTAHYFITDEEAEHDPEEEWPPFRKVGDFDPYSDDPRLGVRKLEVCTTSGALLVGGTAGQVLIFHLVPDANDNKPHHKVIEVVGDPSNVTWKGHSALTIKSAHRYEKEGYQAHCITQLMPPAAITSVSIESSWGVVGLGTSHGYALYDYRMFTTVIAKCTLQNSTPAQEGGLARFGNIKQSLRQSMRRIRGSIRSRNRGSVRASGRRPMSLQENTKSKKIDEANKRLKEAEEKKEREIVMRNTAIPSAETSRTAAIVRVTYFATTFVKDGHGISPSFFVGTAGGAVSIYGLNVPDYSKRAEVAVELANGKELQMLHRAPVINITVVDANGAVGTSNPSKLHNHSLILTSEEQIKVFSLPKVVSKKKFKLTALEGSLMLRAKLCQFQHHFALVTVTNQGEVIIFNPVDRTVVLEKRFDCIDKVNKYGLVYAHLDPCAFGLYPLSMSEFQRYSVSSSYSASTVCTVSTRR